MTKREGWRGRERKRAKQGVYAETELAAPHCDRLKIIYVANLCV